MTSDDLAPTDVTRVHVGCGPKNILKDWWNVDIRGFEGIDQVLDVTTAWPWSDSLEYIYGEHFLEHLTLPQALGFLHESRKALRVGGKIRLTTPALEWVIKTHFTFQGADTSVRIDEGFGINRAFRGWGHQFLYCKEILQKIVEAAGYKNVEFFEYGQSEDPNLCQLECHGGWRIDHGFPSVWIIEATNTKRKVDISDAFACEMEMKFLRYVASGH